MGWFNVEKLSGFVRLLSLLVALWSGSDAARGVQAVMSRPDGVASASAEDSSLITKNAGLSALFAFASANKRMIEGLLGALGLPSSSLSLAKSAIDVGRLADYWRLYARAVTRAERVELRTVASRVNDELFDSLFPVDPPEAAK